jgi:DNA-binding transcriptional LysR family regulator
MNITFRQLRLFLALADTGSVSSAAKALHVTQPTASMQLKEVSQALGLPLYEVIGKKVYLTDVGLELAATARAMSEGLWQEGLGLGRRAGGGRGSVCGLLLDHASSKASSPNRIAIESIRSIHDLLSFRLGSSSSLPKHTTLAKNQKSSAEVAAARA